MRSDISFSSSIHCFFNFGSPRTLATRAAPCFGGGENIVSAFLVRADEMQDADALAVEAEVLREGLRQDELHPALLEETRREVVLFEVTACISLVRVIEERNKLLRLDGLNDLGPLLVRRVDARRVVRARVQQDAAARLHLLDSFHHALEVEATSGLLVVRVRRNLHVALAEDRGVVAPGRVGVVQLRDAELAVEELTRHTKGTGAGKGLARRHAPRRKRRRREDQLLRGLLELRQTIDRQVFLDRLRVLRDHHLGRLDRRKHPRHALLRAVRTDTEVHLLQVRILVEQLRRHEDGIRRRNFHLKLDRGRSRTCGVRP